MGNWNAAGYEQIQARYQYRYGKQLIDRYIETTGTPSGRAVDLGCGEGSLARYLHVRAGGRLSVHGVDLDAGMVQLTRKKNPNLTFTCMDLLEWAEQASGKYDLFFFNAALHWLKNWEKLERLFERLKSKLMPGGHIVCHFSLCENGRALKLFLQQALCEYLSHETISIEPGVFTFTGVRRMLSGRFEILYAEEFRDRPFLTQPGLSFDWMVKAQPLGGYLTGEAFEAFQDFLYRKWLKNPVELETHQCAFILTL